MEQYQRHTLKVSLVQADILWKDAEGNLPILSEHLLSSPGSDVYVLPEMFSTGFVTEPSDVAEPSSDGKTLSWMRTISRKLDAMMVGSVPVRAEDGSFRNRLYAVMPDGSEQFYDKHHLFSYGNEDRFYTPGNDRVIVEFRGVRFLLSVCYDLRFPVWLRSRSDYDAIICVASWPSSRKEAWSTLLKARAIENQAYIIGVNRVGDDPSCSYSGLSAFVDAYGRAEQLPENQVSVMTYEMDLDKLQAFRKKFPVLSDRDSFCLTF